MIANTYLPLDGVTGEELEARKSRKFTVEVKVPSGEITVVSQEDLRLILWDASSNELVFKLGGIIPKSDQWKKVIFRKVRGEWEEMKEALSEQKQPDISLEESMSSRPIIVATDPKSHRRAPLLDLNPQFSDLKFGRVEEITWKGADGIEVKGGLYYPVDYEPGKKYPLVIQTHGWTAERFWIDGPWTTAFAAQPLAGRGMMVLQAEKWTVDAGWWPKVGDSPEEAKKYVTTYERAIDYLNDRGLIDRNRVGIMGFSRTCFYVKYALTNSPYQFTAASVSDGFDAGYAQYVLFSNAQPRLAEEIEGINGAQPYGEGLRTVDGAVDRIQHKQGSCPPPYNGAESSEHSGEWEWFAGLTRLDKPVDMLIIEDGLHELQRPWERMISQQGNVDWFCFWLKGEEDPDPVKAEQYVRWRELRKLQQENEVKAGAGGVN